MTDFTLDFVHAYDPASVDASDFLVNGIAANSFAIVDADTISFHFDTSPITVEGAQTMYVDAGSILRLSDGSGILAWSQSFEYLDPENAATDSLGRAGRPVLVDGSGGAVGTAAGATRTDVDENAVLEMFSLSPALFVENQGQWADESVRYVHNGMGANVALTDAGPVFQLFGMETTGGTQILQFSTSFLGANSVSPVGMDRSETLFNYLVGDQADWRSQLPSYEVVAYQGLYNGIDLHTWGLVSNLKYEFHIAPGADYSQIQVSYAGIEGLSIGEDGTLRVGLGEGWGEVVDAAPFIYQVIGGDTVEIAGQYLLYDDLTYGFLITGEFDPTVELIIDPQLSWSTQLAAGCGQAVAADASGNILVTGWTPSSGWVSGGFDTSHNGGRDAFVAKLSPTGEHIWSTYLGGSENDHGEGIAVDSSGNIPVAGETWSSGWVSGGFDTTLDGARDAFVAKLSAAGGHLWSTYVGGSDHDLGNGIAVDGAGNVLVTGRTQSSGWVSGGFDTSFDGPYDAFVAKLSDAGEHLWSTYLGGSGEDRGYGIAVDGAGNVLVTGWTGSSGWVSGGFDTSHNGGWDIFVTKLSDAGDHVWSTYMGGGRADVGADIAVDGSGNVVVAGRTASFGWASGGFDTSFESYSDAFVTKLSATGDHLWSTYLGGSDWDGAYGVAVDGLGNVLVTGSTASSGWVSDGFDTTPNGRYDAFVAKLSPTGAHLWSSYMGGGNGDADYGIAVDRSGNVLVTGYEYHGGLDAFVKKIRTHVYVDINATGANTGESWEDAYTDLQSALSGAALIGDEIWVAAGTYMPTDGADRAMSFQLRSDVAVYGGFAGTETSRDERDWTVNVTILSGDIGVVDDNSDNSYHVVIGADDAILDGFTITAGYANGGGGNNYGGGMYNSPSFPTVTNCTFSRNTAAYGGGMCNTASSSPTLTNCTFVLNAATVHGGGTYSSSM